MMSASNRSPSLTACLSASLANHPLNFAHIFLPGSVRLKSVVMQTLLGSVCYLYAFL